MSNLIDQPFVWVLWLDAQANNGWSDGSIEGDDPDTNVEVVWSPGFLLMRDRTQVKLAADASPEGWSCNRRIAIPHNMILEIRQDLRTGPILYQRRKRAKETKEQPDSQSRGSE